MKKKFFLAALFIVFGIVLTPIQKVEAQELKEKTGHILDAEFQGIIEESMGNIVSTRATMKSINWSVPSNRRYTTGYFEVLSGKYISLALSLSKSANAGIIDMDGNVRYVTGKNIDHSFKITRSYYYLVFVQNTNSTTITASGNYAYN